MITQKELLIFLIAAIALAMTPGPNMIYLISRSITQGKRAGLISLLGVLFGFLFHITMVAFGLTAVLLAVPFLFTALKVSGAIYLFYLAFQAIKPGTGGIFSVQNNLPEDKPLKLFTMGLLTNLLNPKMAVFYLSLFPLFIRPEAGHLVAQCFQLGLIQITASAMMNITIILIAARAAIWFNANPVWVKIQKWVMASVLVSLATKMLLTKVKGN
ncbi:threonine/homoserine/homoserine lactone efflux protein [Pedobacter cryoconitis]|uniref:Threonine/homoserine/homoserine lactone efflux protein n=1 Tax=Pedobacter cryoconitis TaxID=188932 RepID=A0A7W8ZMT3_9SPHI|nr:LysE family translocator [Pedobacter cryoconitis]MBB5636897.1 threonine/homoserine/homoserine lactone efflux protein [Pedobacter cryoconitis]